MEIQVQELIDKIKKDGISAATEEASKIKAAAEAEAKQIIDSARKQAEEIVRTGKQDTEKSQMAGVAALEQACRNLVLVFKDEIQTLLNNIVNEHVTAHYNEDVLKSVLPEVLKSWAAKGSNDLCVLLPEDQLSKLKTFFTEKLTGELWKGVELKSNRKLSHGFRISNKEGSVYYDFSSEAVASLLSAYLNPKLAEILKSSSNK